jgi:hypothetical protein
MICPVKSTIAFSPQHRTAGKSPLFSFEPLVLLELYTGHIGHLLLRHTELLSAITEHLPFRLLEEELAIGACGELIFDEGFHIYDPPFRAQNLRTYIYRSDFCTLQEIFEPVVTTFNFCCHRSNACGATG